MDIKVININSLGLTDYSFGLYTWTRVAQSVAPGSTKVKLEDVSKFEVGSAFIMGKSTVEKYNDLIGVQTDDTQYIITAIDIVNSIVTVDKPVELGATAGIPCIKLDRGYAQVKKATGVQELVQYIQKCLLTTKGSDSFDPEFGCNIYALLWKITPDQLDEARASLVIEIDKLEKYVKKMQADNPDTKMASLSKLVVKGVSFVYNIQRWSFSIEIITADGDRSSFNV